MPLSLEEAAWRAVDALADDLNITVTELARRAGLNACSFQPCKRLHSNGHPRGLTYRTVHAMCRVAGWSLTEFATAVEDFMAPDFKTPENHHAA